MRIKTLALIPALMLTLTTANAIAIADTSDTPPPPKPPKIQKSKVIITPHRPKGVKEIVDTSTKTKKDKSARVITDITIYAKPDKSSDVVGKLPVTGAIVPIFRQKAWTKIGNPKNGDVGWVEHSTLEKAGVVQVHIQRSIHSGDTHRHTADIQIGDTINSAFEQQQIIRERIERFMNDGMQNFRQLNDDIRKLLKLNQETEKELNPFKTMLSADDQESATPEKDTFWKEIKSFFRFKK